jgi:hypothetical protein
MLFSEIRTMPHKKRIFQFLSCLFFILLMFVLSRQVPFNQTPSLLTIVFSMSVLFLYLGDKFEQRLHKNICLFFLIYQILILYWALYNGNEPNLIFRFFVIVTLLNLVLLIRNTNVKHIEYFIKIYSLQAFIVILIGILMPVFFSLENYGPIRHIVKEYQWGDLYTYNGIYYRVQLLGNALLPFLFFILYDEYRRLGTRSYLLVLSLLAVIFAGNLAFILVLIIYTISYELLAVNNFSLKVEKYKVLFWGVLLLTAPFIIYYFFQLIIMKSTGDVSSIGTRFDQFNVLVASLTHSIISTLFGNGLGYTLNAATMSRDYTGDIYFELQFIYFVNQLGVLGMFTFICLHIYLFLINIRDKFLILMYVCYIFYAAINPYMLDTTHIVVLVLLVSLQHSKYRHFNNKVYD